MVRFLPQRKYHMYNEKALSVDRDYGGIHFLRRLAAWQRWSRKIRGFFVLGCGWLCAIFQDLLAFSAPSWLLLYLTGKKTKQNNNQIFNMFIHFKKSQWWCFMEYCLKGTYYAKSTFTWCLDINACRHNHPIMVKNEPNPHFWIPLNQVSLTRPAVLTRTSHHNVMSHFGGPGHSGWLTALHCY